MTQGEKNMTEAILLLDLAQDFLKRAKGLVWLQRRRFYTQFHTDALERAREGIRDVCQRLMEAQAEEVQAESGGEPKPLCVRFRSDSDTEASWRDREQPGWRSRSTCPCTGCAELRDAAPSRSIDIMGCSECDPDPCSCWEAIGAPVATPVATQQKATGSDATT